MNSVAPKSTVVALGLVLSVLGASLTSCSGCGDSSTANGTDSTGTTTANGARTDGSDGSASGTEGGNAAGHGSDSATHMDTRTSDMTSGDADKTPLTATEERAKTGDEMRGLRAILKAELDAVRGRLGKTADAAAKEADKTRAAELAQGLERIDRAIKAIDEADDVSWGTIRESQMKEAGEVRAWMAKYGMNVSA